MGGISSCNVDSSACPCASCQWFPQGSGAVVRNAEFTHQYGFSVPDLCCDSSSPSKPDCDPTLPYRMGVAGNARPDGANYCVYYDGNGFFQIVDDCCCDDPNNCDRVCQPTAVSNAHWSPLTMLGGCQGDCDSDSECASGLKCMMDAVPPGCTGKTFHSEMDYCYDPKWDSASFTVTAAATEGQYIQTTERTGYNAWPLIFGGIIGFVAVIVMVVVCVMMRRRYKKRSMAQELTVTKMEMVQNMDAIADAPKVVHVADNHTDDFMYGTAVRQGVTVTDDQKVSAEENEVSCAKKEVIVPQTKETQMEQIQVSTEAP